MQEQQPHRISFEPQRGGTNGKAASEHEVHIAGMNGSLPVAVMKVSEKQVNGTTKHGNGRYEIVWSLDRTSDVGRALLAAVRRLREAEVESAQLDAAVLLAYVLGVNKTWVYAHPGRQLTEPEISRDLPDDALVDGQVGAQQRQRRVADAVDPDRFRIRCHGRFSCQMVIMTSLSERTHGVKRFYRSSCPAFRFVLL